MELSELVAVPVGAGTAKESAGEGEVAEDEGVAIARAETQEYIETTWACGVLSVAGERVVDAVRLEGRGRDADGAFRTGQANASFSFARLDPITGIHSQMSDLPNARPCPVSFPLRRPLYSTFVAH